MEERILCGRHDYEFLLPKNAIFFFGMKICFLSVSLFSFFVFVMHLLSVGAL